MGLQGGFIKFLCYLCLQQSRNTTAHYLKRDWPQRTEFSVENNVKWKSFLDPRKVLFPPPLFKTGPGETIYLNSR